VRNLIRTHEPNKRQTLILFVGDSITHGTDWSKWIDFAPFENVAVLGFTTTDVENQLEQIVAINPSIISLLIGTNDFGDVTINRSAEEVVAQIDVIVSAILDRLPEVQILASSILPRGAKFFDRVTLTNGLISKFEYERFSYLDCWPALCNGSELNSEFLLADGFDVHLNSAGYDAWASVLVPELRSLCLQ